MSSTNGSVDQLLELILQLKKTTPAAAKQILNSQPQIAYAVISLLVSMNAIDIEVFKKTLADFAASQAQGVSAATPSQSTPAPAIPPHMQQHQQSNYRSGTPPTATPTPPIAQPQPGYSHAYPQTQGAAGQRYGPQSTSQPPSQYDAGLSGGGYGGYSQYSSNPPYHQPTPPYGSQPTHSAQGYGPPLMAQAPTSQAQNSTPSALSQINPAILAEIPEEQRAMVIHVLSMTPEMISRLPPQDRANILQLRSTLGL